MSGSPSSRWPPSLAFIGAGSDRRRSLLIGARRALARRQGLARPDAFRARRDLLAARPPPAAPALPALAASGRRTRRSRRSASRSSRSSTSSRPSRRTSRGAATSSISVEPVEVMRGGPRARGAGLVRAPRDGVLPLPAAPPSPSGRARAHGRPHGVQRRQGPRRRGGRPDSGRRRAPLGAAVRRSTSGTSRARCGRRSGACRCCSPPCSSHR